MNCLTPDMVERYVSDQLNGNELSAIEKHLKSCASCSKKVKDAIANESMLSELRSLQIRSNPPLKKAPEREIKPITIEDAQSFLGKRYRVVKKVGSGGAGEVFQAIDAILERPVAIKFLALKPSDAKNANRWNEAKMMGQFSHPNIAHVHEIGLVQGWRFIVMEWVEGLPLTEAWAELGLEPRLRIFLDILNAVAAAHRRGIVHRDLKPSNILVTAALDVKILDFGLAVAVDTPGPVERRVYRGTPAYSAPEQISAPATISPATDVFALGILLYQLLTETLPFPQNETKELFKAILLKYPELPNAINEKVPLPLQNICLKALEKEQGKRYADAQAFADDINRYLRGEIVWSRPSFLMDKIQQEVYYHCQKLKSWYNNELITQSEFDRLEDIYERMISPPDPSIIEARRLSLSQVCLYLGGWIAILGSFVLFYDAWERVPPQWRPTPAIGAAVLMALSGLLLWRKNESRLSVGFLATAALLIPLAILLALGHWQILNPNDYPWGKEERLNIHSTLVLGNAQLWIASSCWFIASVIFFKVTRSSAFVLYAVIAFFALLTVCFTVYGLRTWPPDVIAGRYLYPALFLFAWGILIDRKGRSLYAGPRAVVGLGVTIGTRSFIAQSNQTLFGWLGVKQGFFSPSELKFLSFACNGVFYLVLAGICRSTGTRLQRRIAVFLNWLGPVHILAPLRMLDSKDMPHRLAYRVLLPLASMGFVLGSVVRQMKSFFFSGLLGLAVAVHVLTEEHFKKMFAWPIALVAAGVVWMFISWLVPRFKARHTLRRRTSQEL